MVVTDLEGNIIEINEKILQLGRFSSKDDVIGINAIETIADYDQERALDNMAELLQLQEVGSAEFNLVRTDGSEYPTEINANVLLDTNNNPIGFVSVIRDITERKLTEVALQKSEENYRELTENANDGILIATGVGVHVFANRRASEITGYSIKELLNTNIRKLAHPDEFKKLDEFYKKRLNGKKIPTQYETILIRKDGQQVPVELTAARTVWQGQPASMIIFRDNTECKRFENLIRAQRDLGVKLSEVFRLDKGLRICLESALNISTMDCGGIYLFDKESGAFNLIFHKGLSPNFVKKAARFEVDSNNVKLVKSGKPFYTQHKKLGVYLSKPEKREGLRAIAVLPIIHQDEVIGCLNVASHTLDEVPGYTRDALETLTAQIGSAVARLHTVKALRESEERYRHIFEKSSVAIGISTLDGKVVTVNKAMETITGYSSKELKKINLADTYENKNDRKVLLENISRNGRVNDYPTRLKRKDGTSYDALLSISKINLGGKDFLHTICLDITEQKRAEVGLRESEEKFRSLAEKSFDTIFMMDLKGTFTYVSPAVNRVFGLEPLEVIGKKFVDFIPDWELPRAQQVLAKLMNGESIERFEMEIEFKEGETQFIEINSISIQKDKHIVGFQGIIRDITNRKRTENDLKKRLMKFKLEEGRLYLVQERSSGLSVEAINDLIKVGYTGLVISRTPVEDFRHHINGELDFLWLAEKKRKNAFPPVLKKLEQMIESLPPKKIILIERLDYLISKHGFKKVLNFVQHLRELAIISNYIIVLSIDSATLASQELRLFEKETMEVKPSTISALPEHLLEILRFVNSQNIIGIRPSHRDVSKEFRLSKPTTKKRLHLLTSGGYLIEKVKGRQKIVELTEQGKSVFS